MADLYAVAGAKFYIGGAMSAPSDDLDADDFSSVVWTEVDGWETAGAYGDNAALITTQLINRGRDVKQKGTFNAGQMQNNFAILPTDAGQAALKAAARSRSNFPFKIEWDDEPPARSSAVTISNASPGVITWVGHDLDVGEQVSFATTGALPTGLSAATTYYVKTVLSADTFTVAATPGGAAINTSSAGSGTHTVTTEPTPSIDMFVGLVMGAPKQGGNANTARMLQSTIEINSNIVEVLPTGA